MGCSCSKNSIYTISPMAPCLYCAQKHLSSALAQVQLTQEPLEPNVVGQLCLASWHLRKQDKEQFLLVRTALQNYMADNPTGILPAIESVVVRMDQNPHVPQTYKGVIPGHCSVTDPRDPRMGYICLCTAACLAAQIGYTGINRVYTESMLTAAQWHLYEKDWTLAQLIRGLRHNVEQKKQDQLQPAAWKILIDRAKPLVLKQG